MRTPAQVRDWFVRFRAAAESVLISPDAVTLSQAYLNAGIVTPKSAEDALHVALATVAGCSVIVS